MKRISTALFSLFVVATIFMLSIDVAVYADDNATSGDGTSELATEGKGYYRLSEFMYKVTVWVGLYDTADESFSLDNFQMIGTEPIYMRRSNFTLNPNISFTDYCKKDYLEGTHLIPSGTPTVLIDDSLPAIPITHDGNIESVVQRG